MKKHMRHYRGILLIFIFASFTTLYTTLKTIDHEPFAKSSTLVTYDGQICTFSKTGFPFAVITTSTEEPCSYSTVPPRSAEGIKYGSNSYFNFYGFFTNFIASSLIFTAFYLLNRKFNKYLAKVDT